MNWRLLIVFICVVFTHADITVSNPLALQSALTLATVAIPDPSSPTGAFFLYRSSTNIVLLRVDIPIGPSGYQLTNSDWIIDFSAITTDRIISITNDYKANVTKLVFYDVKTHQQKYTEDLAPLTTFVIAQGTSTYVSIQTDTLLHGNVLLDGRTLVQYDIFATGIVSTTTLTSTFSNGALLNYEDSLYAVNYAESKFH